MARLSLFIRAVASRSTIRPVPQLDYAQYTTYAFGISTGPGSDDKTEPQ